ncbi:JAB domain-containing protein [Wolbachia endosymbiont (group A) of Bibio marci]|uniref:JAB domain-containing protein n=1 Tax=Wolbachia endosymbiont (group A) of Bibio marci TaxID=2953987 RepID=UPI00222FC796|nr:DNA repair protein RadC [Wolbachia endosymbiont (group A) of Bibio marci]
MNNNNKSKDRREEIEFRALESEGRALLNHEIVETFLSSVHDSAEARIIAKRLTDSFGIRGILGQEVDDLRVIEGVTDSTVAVILCLREASKRAPREELKEGPVMDNLETIVKYLRVSIGCSEKEKVKILYLDQKYCLKGEEVFTGTVDKAPVYIKEITKKALLKNATLIVMSHNHIEGSAEPSNEDEAAIKKLASACSTIGIRLFDHIIVASADYCSFKEKGLL